MRPIYCFAAAIIFFFSCKKNREEGKWNNEQTVNNISGRWNAGYLGNQVEVSIDTENKFSMDLPLIVKKESNSKPLTMMVRIEGVCVLQDGLYELQGNTFLVLNDGEGAGVPASGSVVQSLEGMDLAIQKDTAILSCRIVAKRL
jgi:hypothetical protein